MNSEATIKRTWNQQLGFFLNYPATQDVPLCQGTDQPYFLIRYFWTQELCVFFVVDLEGCQLPLYLFVRGYRLPPHEWGIFVPILHPQRLWKRRSFPTVYLSIESHVSMLVEWRLSSVSLCVASRMWVRHCNSSTGGWFEILGGTHEKDCVLFISLLNSRVYPTRL